MWLLVSTSQPELKFPVLGDHKYVVGRQNCDIVIPDASVSRKQAVLTMAHYETNVVKSYITPTLTLEDVSKFGTFVNGKAVKNPGGNTVTLKHNDQIKFGGSPASIFKAIYEPFVATTSCLEKAPKKSLHKVMCLMGGHLVRDWRPTCDLLIMSKINVTIKVICAINNQKHIVTPQYLDDLYNHLMGRTDKPEPANYLPEVVDQEVPPGVSFHPDIRRMTLLQGLKFYFLSALQFNKTNLAVSTAGGQPILLEDGTEEEAEAMTEDGTVVVSVSRDILATLSPSCQKFVRLVSSVLRRKNLRTVTDPEIGWAILTCNTEDFCNPKSSITPGMLSTMASQSLSQGLEGDASQSVQMTELKPQKRHFESTLSQDLCISEGVKTPSKKIKLEIPSQGDNQALSKGRELVKTELLSGQAAEEKVDPDLVSPAQHPSRNKSAPAAASLQTEKDGHSLQQKSAVAAALTEPGESEDGTSLPDNREKPLTGANPTDKRGEGSSGLSGNHETTRLQSLQQEADEPSMTTSVFARQKAKKSRPGKASALEDGEDEIVESSSRKAPKRKAALLFDDDDEDDSKNKNNSSINSKKKAWEAEEMSADVLLSDEDSGVVVIKNSGKRDRSGETAGEASEAVSTSLRGHDVEAAAGADSDSVDEAESSLPSVDGEGWLDMRMIKAKVRGEDEGGQEGGTGGDLKPDPELLRDTNGKLLRNLCEVQVTDLISRPPKPKAKSAPDARPDGGQKNFKKFKKTQHVGAGKLPTIIGGRDLEVYLGTKHKDIEDLFSNGLAQESVRQEEEQRGKDLFDWDDRTRKAPAVKRTR